jgi:peptide/nickel transport system permease protein
VGAYLVRRFFQSILVFFLVLVFTFSLPYFVPGGLSATAIDILGAHAPPATIHAFNLQHGFTENYFVRLWQYVDQLVFHGNLGYSYKTSQSVWAIIGIYVPRTVWLALFSLILTVVIALPLGLFQAARRNSIFDYSATSVLFILYGVPAFLLCLLLETFFSYGITHLPPPPTNIDPFQIFTDPVPFILPVAALTLLSLAFLSRFMRSAVLDVLVQDYIRTAKAKGCSELRVLARHAFRNAMGPIIIILGVFLPGLLGGALIIEYSFNYQGLGYETVASALNLDTPTVLGITLLVTIFTLFGNLLADVMLGIVNPRIRVEGK